MRHEKNFFSREEEGGVKNGTPHGRDELNRKSQGVKIGQAQLSPTEENFLRKMVHDY